MTRRPRGDGGLYWDERRQRWIAEITIGYDGRGKRVVRKAAGRTKTEAKNKLRQMLRDQADGLMVVSNAYTVREAVDDWLAYGLANRDPGTQATNRHLCEKHVLPQLGARKLRDLTAPEVDAWLAGTVCDSKHSDASGRSRLPQPIGEACHGQRQGEAERRRTDRGPHRPAGTAVEVVDC